MAAPMNRTYNTLDEQDIRNIITNAVADFHLSGKRILTIIPDRTRTAPIPLMFRLFNEIITPEVKQHDFIIALGTHKPLSSREITLLTGCSPDEAEVRYGNVRIYNHDWDRKDAFTRIGSIPKRDVRELSDGKLSQDLPVRINRLILDYDILLVLGPVFPHEVVGFSGGNKYFFPGIAGPEIIDLTHWLGALMTSRDIIGTKHTPVRRIIDRAASLIPAGKFCFAMVVMGEDLAGLYTGTPETAWGKAADLSSKVHIRWCPRAYRQVLSIMPAMYDDIWTAAKGMYKVEPVTEDGGEVIIYAPHIAEFSYTHGNIIEEVGYHVRDYFMGQWDRFKGYPYSVLAHSTHLSGQGTFDERTGRERKRITVTLATSIDEHRCRQVNLGYTDHGQIDPDAWQGREDEGILVVPKAGEILYRLETEGEHQGVYPGLSL